MSKRTVGFVPGFMVLLLTLLVLWVADNRAEEPVFDHWVYLPLAVKGYDPNAPTPGMATVYWNNKAMNDYPACYEVYGTGIGQACRPIGDTWRLYGTFPAGTYRVVYGSPACKLKDYDKTFRTGDNYHTLFCEYPW